MKNVASKSNLALYSLKHKKEMILWQGADCNSQLCIELRIPYYHHQMPPEAEKIQIFSLFSKQMIFCFRVFGSKVNATSIISQSLKGLKLFRQDLISCSTYLLIQNQNLYQIMKLFGLVLFYLIRITIFATVHYLFSN